MKIECIGSVRPETGDTRWGDEGRELLEDEERQGNKGAICITKLSAGNNDGGQWL